MTSVRRPAHPALQPYLSGYVGYRILLDPRAVHHGVPSPTTTLILAFDEPIDTAWLDQTPGRVLAWTMVGGHHLRPALIRTHGYQHGIQLDLTPLGVRVLLGLPAGALAGSLADTGDLPLRIPPALHARLAETSSWPARFDLLEDFLLRRAWRVSDQQDRSAPPEVAEAWRLLTTTRGRIRIADLAGRLGRSSRWLSASFAAEYGLAPKQAARLHRFDYARGLALDGTPLAATAARAGYADQAHLAREWRDLAGQTPTDGLDNPFRILQDPAPTPPGG